MILTDQNIDYISKNLELYGLKNQELREDILDHICIHIENSEATNFELAYQAAIQKFGGYLNINHIQTETNVQLYFKASKNRMKLSFAIELLTSMFILTGCFFKIMQWPYAGLILFSGFALLILLALPLYFYTRYKEKLLKYQS
ncbi:MAG: hypothetical protein AB8B65_14790 [Kordia sp.]|uniref:hypothetical protein n=1 Tax=Kordia sp. TaxID=1965332 RepID=UPI00385E76B1